MTGEGELLAGGNVAAAVLRVGDTVRKPWTPATPFVHEFLRHLSGLPGVPRVLGRDSSGRQILAYVPGSSAESLPPMTVAELGRLGGLVRSLHDASADFVPSPGAVWESAIPADGAELICHQDLAPWNLIRDGDRWTFIDWDAAAPGTRLWDLAYVAQTFAPLLAGGDPAVDGPRLRAVVDGYDLAGPGRSGRGCRGCWRPVRGRCMTCSSEARARGLSRGRVCGTRATGCTGAGRRIT